uniref:mitochondrial adenyl nucleotide antiporter SLC25A24-like n=1 Tax=Pristiophorus japonicus TaxID=55135 RepID=UPI00398EB6D1
MQVLAPKKRQNLFRSWTAMVVEGGHRSLWRGNGMNVAKIAPETGIKFLAYDQYKKLFEDGQNKLDLHHRFLAGSLAGATAQTIIYPMEVLKTRLAMGYTGQYHGINDCLRYVIKHGGWRALYTGYLPNLLGIIPYAGIELTVYETVKKAYCQKYNQDPKNPGVIVHLGCGTFSSTCGQLGSYPLALVRTKMQAHDVIRDGAKVAMHKYFHIILQDEGFIGLYRGFAANSMKVVPAVSISFVIYEQMKRILGLNSN